MTTPRKQSVAEHGLPLKEFLTYRLNRVHAQLTQQATRYIGQHSNISITQWRMIAVIGDQGQSNMTEVSRNAGVDKALVSRTVKGLIAQGLVKSSKDAKDQRMQRLSLTDAGEELFRSLLPKMQARQRFLRASLTTGELSALESALDKLLTASEETEFTE